MYNITVRSAEPKDIIRLREVEIQGFMSPWGEEALSQEIRNQNRTCYLVGEISGQIVAYAGLWVIFDEGHITRIVVDPKFRRQGIARELVKALMEKGSSLGCERFTLEVRSSNKEAIGLYSDIGFEQVGIRSGYYEEEEEDALIMWYNPPEYIRRDFR